MRPDIAHRLTTQDYSLNPVRDNRSDGEDVDEDSEDKLRSLSEVDFGFHHDHEALLERAR